MKTRTDRELRQLSEMINACSFNFAKGKKYDDRVLVDRFLDIFNTLSLVLNSEGYYVERVGTDHFDDPDVTYNTYEVRRSSGL